MKRGDRVFAPFEKEQGVVVDVYSSTWLVSEYTAYRQRKQVLVRFTDTSHSGFHLGTFNNRDFAARAVADNWRIRKRLPRITAYARKIGLIHD
jgi:hypothetical protein